MPDELSDMFDDDSLMPDWLQDGTEADPSGKAPSGDAPPDSAAAVPAASAPAARPPWETAAGDPPPAPTAPPAAPPWEVSPGATPTAPAAPPIAPPWETAAGVPPPAASAAQDEFDWGAADTGEAAPTAQGEIPRGFTGELPWMDDEQTGTAADLPDELSELGGLDELDAEADPYAGPSMAERAGLSDDQFTLDALADEFEADDAEAPPAETPPSLAARLQAEAPAPEDAEWLGAFRDAAEYDDGVPEMGDAEDDMAWLEDGADDAAPVDEDQSASPIRRLSPTPPPVPADEAGDEEIPAWPDDDLDEPDADDQPARPIRRLSPQDAPADTGEVDDGDDLAWLDDAFDEAADQPVADEPPASPIHRLTPDDPAEMDAGEGDLPDWLRDDDFPAEATAEVGAEAAPPDAEGLTFEEWEQREIEREREAAKTPEERAMEQVPEWFDEDAGGDLPLPDEFATPAPAPEASAGEEGPEFVPDWLLGMEEQDDEEAPEWFRDMDLAADPLAAPPPEPEPPPAEQADTAPAAEPQAELPDWFQGEGTGGLDDIDFDATFGGGGDDEEDEMADEEPVPLPGQGVPPDEPPIALGPDDADDTEPGEIPDWLADAAPEGTGPADDRPLPDDLDAVFDAAEAEAGGIADDMAPGQVPDWLADAAPPEEALPADDLDAVFDAAEADAAPDEEPLPAPEDVPFPDLDLDQPMPSGEEEPADDWMADFAPDAAPGAMPPPSRVADDEPVEDFVERFDPLAPEEFPDEPAEADLPAGLDDDAPDWLREMEAGEPGTVPAGEEPLPLPDDIFGEAEGGILDEPDWLQELSADDVAEGDEQPAEAAGFPPPDEDQLPDEAEEVETESLDSQALDQLLGLVEPEDGTPGEPSALVPAGEEPAEDAVVPEDFDWDAMPEMDEDAGAGDPGDMDDIFGVSDDDDAIFGVSDDDDAIFGVSDDDDAIFGVPDEDDIFGTPGEEELPGDLAAALDEAGEAEPAPDADDIFPPPEPARPPALEVAPEPPPEPEEPEEATASTRQEQPDWVDELRPSELPVTVKGGGAEVSVRQRQVGELPDRLQALHRQAADTLQAEPGEAAEATGSGTLEGISGLLPTIDLAMGQEAPPVEGLVITPEQRLRLDRLQAMLDAVAAEEEEALEGPDALQATDPFTYGMEEGADEEAAAEAVAPRQRPRRAVRYKADRLLIALVVLVALIAPFGTDALHFADDPPALSDERAAVAAAIDALQPGDYVLFAFEYSPTAAGELDPLVEAVLRDTLAGRAIPFTTSTNPLGAFHAAAVLAELDDDEALLAARSQNEDALEPGEDYVTLGYLPGDAIGVRTLRAEYLDEDGLLKVHPAFETDLRGDRVLLTVGSLVQDIALIVVAGEEARDARIWAEQLSDVPVAKVALVTTGAEPLVAPYADGAGYLGYLAGVRDTVSYNQSRNTASRAPYIMPDDAPDDMPQPEEARWHSMALGAAVAAGLIALGVVINLLRGLGRRRRR